MIKILVWTEGDPAPGQIAAGYFRFYGHAYLEVFHTDVAGAVADPSAVQVMAEDGIDITSLESSTPDSLDPAEFQYVLVPESIPNHHLSSGWKKQSRLIRLPGYHSPGQKGTLAEEQLQQLRDAREEIKKYVLKFIGKEIMSDI